jgi:putative hydrolase of the HAD superfamily
MPLREQKRTADSDDKSQLRAVLFDCGGVLTLPPTPEDWATMASTICIPLQKFMDAYWKFRDGYDRSVYDAYTYWRLIGETEGCELQDEVITTLVDLDNQQWTKENAPVIEICDRLRSDGIKTAILSNMEFELLAAIKEKFSWLQNFDIQMYSCELGIVKPSMEIFSLAVRLLKVRPDDILFVDDKERNVIGAAALGMKTLWYQSSASQLELESAIRR